MRFRCRSFFSFRGVIPRFENFVERSIREEGWAKSDGKLTPGLKFIQPPDTNKHGKKYTQRYRPTPPLVFYGEIKFRQDYEGFLRSSSVLRNIGLNAILWSSNWRRGISMWVIWPTQSTQEDINLKTKENKKVPSYTIRKMVWLVFICIEYPMIRPKTY